MNAATTDSKNAAAHKAAERPEDVSEITNCNAAESIANANQHAQSDAHLEELSADADDPSEQQQQQEFATTSQKDPAASAAEQTNLWTRLSDGFTLLMRRARDHLRSTLPASATNAADELVRSLRYPGLSASVAAGVPVTLLGRTYPSLAHQDFLDDFHSRPWMTYRRGFPPIAPSAFTTDAGWGCMLRSGQMLLASAFVLHELGRDWRIGQAVATTSSTTALQTETELTRFVAYAEILSRFLDVHASPYSIHRIALLGRQFDKQVGEWFGPSTISQVIRTLVNSDEKSTLSVLVANDGVLYKDEAHRLLETIREDGRPSSLLILIPLRLGLDAMNPVYYPNLKKCFEMPHCVGVAGGRPNSSLFFVGFVNDYLVYLDPHTIRSAMESNDIASYTAQDILSYHCDSVRLLPIASVDPSLVIGFYCQDSQSFEKLCRDATQIAKGQTPLFTIQDEAPHFDEHGAEIDVMSEYDDL